METKPSDMETKHLRSFGIVVGTGFAIIALWPLVVRGQAVRMWALLPAVALFAAAMAFPHALRPVHRRWMAVGEALGWVNTRVILTAVYGLLIVPIGALGRMKGKDPMRRKFEPEAESYRIPRTKRPASHMERQY